jgi:hypothetical protein
MPITHKTAAVKLTTCVTLCGSSECNQFTQHSVHINAFSCGEMIMLQTTASSQTSNLHYNDLLLSLELVCTKLFCSKNKQYIIPASQTDFWKWITTLKQEKGTKYRLIVSSHPLQPSVSRMSRQCGILNISQPHRPPQPVTGIGNSTITEQFLKLQVMGKQLQLVRNQSFWWQYQVKSPCFIQDFPHM